MARIRNIDLETVTRIKMYFTGELDKKIKRFEKKKDKKWPDEYYCTLHSTGYVIVTKNSNGISDPTGSRAVKLAGLSRCRSDDYLYYKQLKQTITDVLQQLNDNDIYLLKAETLHTKDSIKNVAEKLELDYRKSLKRIKEIVRYIDRKISGIVV